MIRFRINSLELRLAGLMGALLLATTALAVAVLFLETNSAVRSLSNQNLLERARLLSQSVLSTGSPMLPSDLASLYDDPEQPEMYAIRESNGTVLAASNPDIRRWVTTQAMPASEPGIFKLENFRSTTQEYYGLSILLDSSTGPLAVTVANAGDDDSLLHAMMEEFAEDVAWVIPVFILVTLLVGTFAIRSGLKPVREIAEQAAAIEPEAMSVRLNEKNLPVEIRPLVEAVNKALDRLEAGFDQQRRFTANAAHELRTPLTIITGALDMLPGNGDIEKIKVDVARMNRLIDQ
ncbi:MAG: histidine kinase dimerization/phospho-acceptor domain-containing protein, partial [Pseudomonadales bacterium]|nr:histidine kinase dimerization/phospho-acceptor domain-containing protein [Pseudomonadales bacterium]